MSRIGKLPIEIPANVEVAINGQLIVVNGKLGKLKYTLPNEVTIVKDSSQIVVSIEDQKNNKARAMWGLSRSLVYNMVKGVSVGFKKVLEVNGVGYRANVKQDILTLFLGFSHEIKYLIPQGIEVICPKPTQIEIFGYDKEKVGQVAADIRKLRKPEPYKGKGVKYENEVIYRKEGKKK